MACATSSASQSLTQIPGLIVARTALQAAMCGSLELHGVANQVFQTVYYFSAGARKDVVFDHHVTHHCVAPTRALATASPLPNRTRRRQYSRHRPRAIFC